MPALKSTTIRGIRYRSFTAACAAFGHAAPKVRHRMAAGMSLEEALTGKNYSTGAKAHPSYSCWNAMNSRCYSKGNYGYKFYGARGITVCDRWRHDFWAFVEDMGIRPSKSHTVDRIDNALGYSRENCRWLTHAQQQRNRTNNVAIGAFRTLIEASEETGLSPATLGYRKRMWGDALALSAPRHSQLKKLKATGT